jgi:hypothetical protein
MKRTLHAVVAFLLLVCVARAGPEFRVVTGLLTLFDSGRKTAIRYNTQTDVNFEEGGSVRVLSTVTPEGMADVEIMARSKVDFYFLGADVSLAPSGTIRATVENIQHPQIKLTWDGGIASASKVLQTPEELLSYFIVSQPPVFSKSPIADDELSRIYPQTEPSADHSRSPDSKDAVEVDFPFASPSPTKGPEGNSANPAATGSPRAKPSPSPSHRPAPSRPESKKALLAQTAHSLPVSSPTPESASTNAGQMPEPIAKPSPSPSPDLMPDLPISDFPSPEIILGGGTSANPRTGQTAAEPRTKHGNQTTASDTTPILKSLLPGAAPVTTPTALTSATPASIQSPQLAKNLTGQPMDLLDWTDARPPKEMPTMHAPTAKRVLKILPLILPSGIEPAPRPRRATSVQAMNTFKDGPLPPVSVQRPDIVLGGQQEFMEVQRALPADNDPGLGHDAAVQEAQERTPDPVLLSRAPLTKGPSPQITPFVISSAITRKNP